MKRIILGIGFVFLFAASSLVAQTLTVWDFKFGEVNAGGAQAPMKQIDALFEKANPGVKVNHVSQPLEPQYYQIIQSAATANDGPDVAMFHPGARDYGFDDILVDLGPYIKDVKGQFTQASIEMVSIGGKLGAPVKLLPMTMQGFGIYYNKAYFKKAGLDPEKAPKTAKEFLAACEKPLTIRKLVQVLSHFEVTAECSNTSNVDDDGVADIPLDAKTKAISGGEARIAVAEHIGREQRARAAQKRAERSIVGFRSIGEWRI